MQSTFKIERDQKVIKRWLLLFMIILALSGITAMPVEWELSFAVKFFNESSLVGNWLNDLYVAVKNTNKNYPYLPYGYDWLAFAHVVLAIVFIGPYKNPVKNKWVIEFGAIACLLIIPFALIMGYFRGIPIWWRLIDCSFGIVGMIPLSVCYNKINQIEKIAKSKEELIYSF
jgi:hypothetical protein